MWGWLKKWCDLQGSDVRQPVLGRINSGRLLNPASAFELESGASGGIPKELSRPYFSRPWAQPFSNPPEGGVAAVYYDYGAGDKAGLI